MDKVYVCYSEGYDGISNDLNEITIGVASTEEKAIELINEYANLNYANREHCPCNDCENSRDCDSCNLEHRFEEEWHKKEDSHGYIQRYEGEYDSWVAHYYKPFELDKLHEIGS